MKTTRRSAVTASGFAALGLAGCTADEPESSPGSAPATTSTPTSTATETVTGTGAADPDQVALDRAMALTAALLVALEGAQPVLDPGGRLAALHAAHLGALQEATASSETPTPLPAPSGRMTAARLRRRELQAQRELAKLAQSAESGALARVLASMSAGIAAGLSHRGEVPR